MKIIIGGLLGFFLGALIVAFLILMDEHIRTRYKLWVQKKLQEANQPQKRNPIGFLKNNIDEQQH